MHHRVDRATARYRACSDALACLHLLGGTSTTAELLGWRCTHTTHGRMDPSTDLYFASQSPRTPSRVGRSPLHAATPVTNGTSNDADDRGIDTQGKPRQNRVAKNVKLTNVKIKQFLAFGYSLNVHSQSWRW